MQPIVLITGGSRGIGAATALLAAQQGWAVAVNYVANALAADAVVRHIVAAGGRAIAVQADVADWAYHSREIFAGKPPQERLRFDVALKQVNASGLRISARTTAPKCCSSKGSTKNRSTPASSKCTASSAC